MGPGREEGRRAAQGSRGRLGLLTSRLPPGQAPGCLRGWLAGPAARTAGGGAQGGGSGLMVLLPAWPLGAIWVVCHRGARGAAQAGQCGLQAQQRERAAGFLTPDPALLHICSHFAHCILLYCPPTRKAGHVTVALVN